MLDKAGFRGPLIIENYVWRDRGTDPLDELAKARDYILSSLKPVTAGGPEEVSMGAVPRDQPSPAAESSSRNSVASR